MPMPAMRHALPRKAPAWPLVLALSLAAGLGGCGKVTEMAGEKAAEKMMESAISKDGGSAKVDISSEGTVKAEGVDKGGKAYKVEVGQADVSEKDIGVAFYPGAKVDKGSRIANGDQLMVQVELVSSDGLSKVAEWYRGQLKPRMAGNQQAMEQTTQDSAMLMVGGANDESLMVNITKDGDSGSRIGLVHHTKSAPCGPGTERAGRHDGGAGHAHSPTRVLRMA